MPYVKGDGTIVERDPLGFFWGFLNFFYLLFQTLINPNYNSSSKNTAGSGGSGKKKMGGFGPSGSGPDPPPMGGCSSCR